MPLRYRQRRLSSPVPPTRLLLDVSYPFLWSGPFPTHQRTSSQDGSPLAASAKMGHQLLPVHAGADSRCGVMPSLLIVLLLHKRRMAALRLISSPSSINPASARLCRSFPALLKARAPDSHRALCTCLAPNVMPLNWKTPLRSPPVGTHLPVDALAHLTLPLLEGLSFAPLINSSLLLNLPALPSDEIMTNAYRPLKRRAQTLMMEHWCSLPLLDYYPYPLRLSPHPFMGLGKFMAGRIHQMRSQNSYLAAHPSWFNAHDSPLCPLCSDEPERFSHAILRCPAKASPRARHLQGLSSVDHDAPSGPCPPSSSHWQPS